MFVNMCQNELIKMATVMATAEGVQQGQQWSVPYSLTQGRLDIDNGTLWT